MSIIIPAILLQHSEQHFLPAVIYLGGNLAQCHSKQHNFATCVTSRGTFYHWLQGRAPHPHHYFEMPCTRHTSSLISQCSTDTLLTCSQAQSLLHGRVPSHIQMLMDWGLRARTLKAKAFKSTRLRGHCQHSNNTKTAIKNVSVQSGRHERHMAEES